MDIDELPGCCAFTVLRDWYFHYPKQKILEIERYLTTAFEQEFKEDSYAGVLFCLTQQQIKQHSKALLYLKKYKVKQIVKPTLNPHSKNKVAIYYISKYDYDRATKEKKK